MYLCKLKIAILKIMIEVKIQDAVLQQAAEAGMDEFVKAFVDAIREAIGGELTAETMAELNSDQITLLAWDTLHEEMMDGGMIQLIHNGYGAFLWKNPTDKAFRNWGLVELSKLIKKSHFLYKSGNPAFGAGSLWPQSGFVVVAMLEVEEIVYQV